MTDKTPDIAACDTQVLMWAFPWAMRPEKKKKTAPQNVPEMRQRAKMLMRLLGDRGVGLCVPSIVIAELLAGIEQSNHAKVLAAFEQRLFCPPFDTSACILAAKLFQYERGLPGVSAGLPAAQRSNRKVLKADTLIVASAKIAGATSFYSHEPSCRRLAEYAGIEAFDLPTSTGNWVMDKEVMEEEIEERDT